LFSIHWWKCFFSQSMWQTSILWCRTEHTSAMWIRARMRMYQEKLQVCLALKACQIYLALKWSWTVKKLISSIMNILIILDHILTKFNFTNFITFFLWNRWSKESHDHEKIEIFKKFCIWRPLKLFLVLTDKIGKLAKKSTFNFFWVALDSLQTSRFNCFSIFIETSSKK